MTIAEVREKCKGAIAKVPRDIFIITVLVLASSASFVLGYFTGLDAGQGSTMILETNPLSVSPLQPQFQDKSLLQKMAVSTTSRDVQG